MRFYRLLFFIFLLITFLPLPCKAEDTDNTWPAAEESQQQLQPGISYILRGETLARSGDPFAAIVEYRKAIAAGYNNSDVYRNLSTVLYLAGFIDEATETLEEAVRLHPKEVFPRQELGVLYFAKGNIAKAKETFISVAADNPALAGTYYYLGLIAYQQENFDEAWLYVRRAQLLGHQDNSLLKKMLARGNEPLIDQRDPVGDDLCFRQILQPSFVEAEKSLDRLRDGEMFEVVASTASIGPSAENGGFVGCLFPDELNATLAAPLWEQKAYDKPTIVETDRGAHIIQRVQSFDPELWRIQIAALKRPKPKLSKAILKQGLSQEELGRYVVHAGTYNGPVLASAMVSRLRYEELPAYFYTTHDEKGGLKYQVVAGRYPGKADAAEISKHLDDLGISNHISDSMQEEPTQQDEQKIVAAAPPETAIELTKEETTEPPEVAAEKPATTPTPTPKPAVAASATATAAFTTKAPAPAASAAEKKEVPSTALAKANNEKATERKTVAAPKTQPKKTTATEKRKKTTNKDIIAARAMAAR
ncbi:MAG: SPOR domain-containing protein, partial [Desulfobulbaceae bacterium]|nr:SPOR domain-containing protein [Desulfobulbaceae bacterium]